MEIRVLRGADVRRLLPMAECIDLMRQTMIATAERRVVLPLRSVMVMPDDKGMLGNMPGYLADPECFGVKLVSLIPRNKPPQYSSHLGLVLLFEAEGLSVQEVAEVLEEPRGTILARLSRTRAELREAMQAIEGGQAVDLPNAEGRGKR